MKEHPILFSADMVRAILEGRKTQTRRIMKPQPHPLVQAVERHNKSTYLGKIHLNEWQNEIRGGWKCPYGESGELLWVRETFTNDANNQEKPIWVYKADAPNYTLNSGQRWKPSIHMPRIASRITLEIEDIRAERLQDISEEDAIAEGIEIFGIAWKIYHKNHDYYTQEPIIAYKSLWQTINGWESWDQNPWVWVIKFKII